MNILRFVPAIFLVTTIVFTTASCKKDGGKTPDAASVSESGQHNLNVAFVNMDSVYARLDYFQEMKAELQKMEANIASELQGIQRNIISVQTNLQKRIKNKDISEEEMMNTEKRLVSLNNSLQSKQESLSAQFMEKQSMMAMDIEELTNAFFKEYNKEKGYDLILANNQVKTVFYASEQLDITSDITTAFNEFVSKVKRSMAVNETLGSLQKSPADTSSAPADTSK